MTGRTAMGTLTTAILLVVREAPGTTSRQVMAALKPQGFNGHSIRETMSVLVRSGALECDRSDRAGAYRVPTQPAAASIAQRVLQAMRQHGPQLCRDLIARFPDLEPFSVRNALITLQSDGRVGRVGTRHQYRYYATEATRTPAVQLASVTGQLLRASEPAPRVDASSAPRWPAPTAAQLGPPMIGWRGLEPVEVAA